MAASRSGWETVKILVQLGANIHLKDANQRNILHLIVTKGGNIEEFAENVRQVSDKNRKLFIRNLIWFLNYLTRVSIYKMIYCFQKIRCRLKTLKVSNNF